MLKLNFAGIILVMEGAGSGTVTLTNGSGSGRSKNIRIRIPHTDQTFEGLRYGMIGYVSLKVLTDHSN